MERATIIFVFIFGLCVYVMQSAASEGQSSFNGDQGLQITGQHKSPGCRILVKQIDNVIDIYTIFFSDGAGAGQYRQHVKSTSSAGGSTTMQSGQFRSPGAGVASLGRARLFHGPEFLVEIKLQVIWWGKTFDCTRQLTESG